MTTKPGRFSGLVESRKTPETSEPIEETSQPIEETSQPVEETRRPAEVVTRAKTSAKLAKYKDPDRKASNSFSRSTQTLLRPSS